MSSSLVFKNFSVSAEKKEILHGINFSFSRGKIYALMGPNGSGKSTLALSALGYPGFSAARASKILLNNKDITRLSTEKRARAGLFLTFQSPVAFSGVTVFQVVRAALGEKQDALTLKDRMETIAEELRIPKELLSRSLNDGFSGGQRKKMEILQMALLDPSVIFFDEVDTGVDADAIKDIGHFLKKFHSSEKTFILITHSARFLHYLTPDEVIIMKDGVIAARGDKNLAQRIEQEGYEKIEGRKQ